MNIFPMHRQGFNFLTMRRNLCNKDNIIMSKRGKEKRL